jgi:hypothetical protein
MTLSDGFSTPLPHSFAADTVERERGHDAITVMEVLRV